MTIKEKYKHISQYCYQSFRLLFRSIRDSLIDLFIASFAIAIFVVSVVFLYCFFNNAIECFIPIIKATTLYLIGLGEIPKLPFSTNAFWRIIIITFIILIKLLLIGVPIGIIASRFNDEIKNYNREQRLEDVRLRLFKAFRRVHSPAFDEYLAKYYPHIANRSKFTQHYFVPRKVSIAKLQTRGLKLDDIIETVNKYPEFRMKNMATAISMEKRPEDRLIVEHFPYNTDYGCRINRGSYITIVSTNSVSEIGTGWFAYYLAKLGGFNYISKEFEVDSDEPDSFYAMPDKIIINGMTEKEMGKNNKKYKHELSIIKSKTERRQQFIDDLMSLCNGEDRWCIMFLSHIKNKTNTNDMHFAHCMENGQSPTINDMKSYNQLFKNIQKQLKKDFQLSIIQTNRYPLKPSYLAYKLRKMGCNVNAFTIRVSSDIICFDSRTESIMYRMANVINRMLKKQGVLPIDDEDFKKKTFGYTELKNYK